MRVRRRDAVACPAVGAEIGQRGAISLVVGEADTAIAMRSGSVPVLATPRVVALVEEAACQALAGHLPDGITSVGMRVQIDHLQPTSIGIEVEAEAMLEKIDGRRLVFTVSVSDPRGLIAVGKVTRVLVEVDRFLDKSRCG